MGLWQPNIEGGEATWPGIRRIGQRSSSNTIFLLSETSGNYRFSGFCVNPDIQKRHRKFQKWDLGKIDAYRIFIWGKTKWLKPIFVTKIGFQHEFIQAEENQRLPPGSGWEWNRHKEPSWLTKPNFTHFCLDSRWKVQFFGFQSDLLPIPVSKSLFAGKM